MMEVEERVDWYSVQPKPKDIEEHEICVKVVPVQDKYGRVCSPAEEPLTLRVSSLATAGQVKVQLALILQQKPEDLELYNAHGPGWEHPFGDLDRLSCMDWGIVHGLPRDTPEMKVGWAKGREAKAKPIQKKRDESPTSTDCEDFTEIKKFSWVDEGHQIKLYVDQPAEALVPGTEVCVDFKKLSCALSVRNPEGQIFVLTLHPLYGPIHPGKSKYKFSEGKRITITLMKPGPVQKLEGQSYYDSWVELVRDDGKFMSEYGMTPSFWGKPPEQDSDDT